MICGVRVSYFTCEIVVTDITGEVTSHLLCYFTAVFPYGCNRGLELEFQYET